MFQCVAKIFFLTSFFLNANIWAEEQDHETTEYAEPIAIEETYPNEPGEYDLRLSFEYQDQEEEGKDIDFFIVPKGQFFFGITDRLGGEIEFSYVVRDEEGEKSENGIGNVGIGLKYLLYENKEQKTALVLGGEVEFPTADKDRELGEGKYEFSPFIAHLKDFKIRNGSIEHLLWQGNIGYRYEQNDESEESFFYNQSIAMPFADSERVNFFLEIFGSVSIHTEEEISKDPVYFSPGVKYNFTDEFFAAIGVPIGINSDADDVRVVFQLQAGFGE